MKINKLGNIAKLGNYLNITMNSSTIFNIDDIICVSEKRHEFTHPITNVVYPVTIDFYCSDGMVHRFGVETVEESEEIMKRILVELAK